MTIRNALLTMNASYPGKTGASNVLQIPAYFSMEVFGPFLVFQLPRDDEGNISRLMFKLEHIDEIETHSGAV